MQRSSAAVPALEPRSAPLREERRALQPARLSVALRAREPFLRQKERKSNSRRNPSWPSQPTRTSALILKSPGQPVAEKLECAWNQIWIEVRTGTTAHFVRCLAKRLWSVVRAFVDHRIHGIHNGEYPGAKGNPVAFQTPRVTAAVKFFVMSKNQVCGFLQKFDVAEEFEPVFRVLPHGCPFVVVQLA